MTQNHHISDIKEMIAEGAVNPAQRTGLEALAEALDETLAEDVPFRPQFKVELRRKLMTEARRNLHPWYGRPAAWGSALGVAAAAAVLMVGLNLIGGVAPKAPSLQPPMAVQPDPPKSVVGAETPITTTLTSLDLPVPVVLLPDESLTPTSPGPESMADVDLSKGLPLYRLTGRVDQRLFSDVALRLGFPATAGLTATEGSRMLQLTPDGQVVYTDESAADPAGTATDGREGALVLARRFLDRAALPVPDLQPAVTGERPYVVTYTPRVAGRPVVNGQTVIRVSERSGIVRAEAYVATGQEATRQYAALSVNQALAQATVRGGKATFSSADLVWVRTLSDQTVFLQPYWRAFGVNAQGERLARYVPAVVR